MSKPKKPDDGQPAISYAERSMRSYVFSVLYPDGTRVSGNVRTARGTGKLWVAHVARADRVTTLDITTSGPSRDAAVRALIPHVKELAE